MALFFKRPVRVQICELWDGCKVMIWWSDKVCGVSGLVFWRQLCHDAHFSFFAARTKRDVYAGELKHDVLKGGTLFLLQR